MVVTLICSAVIGPSATIWSSSSLGIFGSAALLAAIAAFFSFVRLGSLLGMHAPCGHVMPRTQNSGQAPSSDRTAHSQEVLSIALRAAKSSSASYDDEPVRSCSEAT